MQFTLEFSPYVTYVAFQYGDREVKDLWSKLKAKIPEFFQDIPIKPQLLVSQVLFEKLRCSHAAFNVLC